MGQLDSSKECPRCGDPIVGGGVDGLCATCLAAIHFSPATEATLEPAPPLTPVEIAPHFPQLEILECLGRGGMGVVYKARQKSLDRLVALKLMAPERAGDPAFAERFEREARALAALNHPHIVGIHDFGQAGGFFYLLMEYVDGVNLRALLAARRLSPEEALAIVPPICDALQCAHERGIVHRDIKPENLLMDRSGVVKIADFGVAKMLGDETGGSMAGAGSSPLGTPEYAAPEQRDGGRADHRADIFSLGVVLYEMLTGERPGRDFAPPSHLVRVDVRIDEIVLRALEREPELRFPTAAAFRERVRAAAEPETPPRLGKIGRAFVALPQRTRRVCFLAALIGGLVFTVLFCGLKRTFFHPDEAVPAQWVSRWEYGLVPGIGDKIGGPWFHDETIQQANHTRNVWRTLHWRSTSFAAGAVAAAIWLLVALAAAAESRARLPLEERAFAWAIATPGEKPRVHGWRLLAAAAVMLSAFWVAMGFFIAGMMLVLGDAPAPLSAMLLGSVGVIFPLLAQLRKGSGRGGVPPPARWLRFAIFVGIALLLFAFVARTGNDLLTMAFDRMGLQVRLRWLALFFLLLVPMWLLIGLVWLGRRLLLPKPAALAGWQRGILLTAAVGLPTLALLYFYTQVRLQTALSMPARPVEAILPPASFPASAHIGRGGHSVLVVGDRGGSMLHYVLYHAGHFSSSSGGSQNAVTNTWVDEGTITLKNGRPFGYRRESLYPDELRINGVDHDLLQGRVLVLREDGAFEQKKLFPPLAVASDPEALAAYLSDPPPAEH